MHNLHIPQLKFIKSVDILNWKVETLVDPIGLLPNLLGRRVKYLGNKGRDGCTICRFQKENRHVFWDIYVKHYLCKVSVSGGFMGGVGDVPIM